MRLTKRDGDILWHLSAVLVAFLIIAASFWPALLMLGD